MRVGPAPRAASHHLRRAAWAVGLALILLVGSGLLAPGPGHAARRDFYFHAIDSEDGLAQNTINALLQDPDGFVWIATQGGLHRYDGQQFLIFQHRSGDAASLPESFITALAQGEGTTLFVGTSASHVSAFDRATGAVRRYVERSGPEVAGASDMVLSLLFEPGVGLWVGTAEGVERLDPADGSREPLFRFESAGGHNSGAHALAKLGDSLYVGSHEGLLRSSAGAAPVVVAGPASPVAGLLRTGATTLWVGAGDGLYRIEGDGAAPVRAWPPAGEPASRAVVSLAQDPQGVLWAAIQDDGLLRLDPLSGTTQRVRHQPEVPASLPEPSVHELMVDRSGLLWVGGEWRGLATTPTRGTPFAFVLDLDPGRDRVATNNIRALHQDVAGMLWVGTEGDGLKRYDPVADRFEVADEPLRRALGREPAAGTFRVLGIVPGERGQLWVSSNLGLFRLDPRARRAERVDLGLGDEGDPGDSLLRAATLARDGSLWIATFGAGLVHFHPDDGEWHAYRSDPADAASLSHDLVITSFEDRRGRIWIGTLDGLNLLEPSSGRIRRLLHDPGDPRSISGNLVRVVHQAADGTLWVGTHSGLNRLVEHEDGGIAFERIGVEHGLPNATIYGILEDRSGALWLSSNGGLTRFDPADRSFRSFGLREGIQDPEFNGGAYLALDDGRLAFGGIRGFNLFDPQRIEPSRFEPPVVITAIRVGASRREDAGLRSPATITLDQDDRVLRVEFAALDFAAPEKNRFRYRLAGFDADWIDALRTPEATYTNLDPGSYTLEILASNHDGVWNSAPLAIPLEVRPAWWNSLPARLGYALAAVALVALLVVLQRRRREAERGLLRQISEREERLKLALWGSGDEFWDWNVVDNTIYRLGADQLLGLREEHSMSTDDWRSRSVHPDDLPRVQRILHQHISGQTEFFESEHRIRNAQGRWIWVRSRGKVVERDGSGNPLRIAGTARDITASRRAERERRVASEVLRSMGEAVAVIDLDFAFVSVNPAFSRITGWSEDEVVGQSSDMLDSTQHNAEFYRRVRESLQQAGHWQGEMWQKRKDGEEFLGWIELSEVRDNHGVRTHFVAVVSDITDKKRAEQELRYLANYDTLTGLPDRTLLAERLARAVVRARRQDTRVAVLFLDLDRFKDINDSMGHAAGDRILKAAAARLLTTVRETDTVARLGGDEFTVVLEDLEDIETASGIARKILTAFHEPLELDGRSDVVISPSIGVSLYPDHGLVPTDLLKFADTAMYQAKDRGRNTYQFYTEAMDAEARRRATMISALRKALDRGEFRLVYQPRLSLLDGRITGVEALLRWHSEDIGEVEPSVFIPLAEETGLILSIGEWALREACQTLRRWRHHGLDHLGMAVNVSVLQLLRGDLPAVLRRVLAEIPVPPERVELEVTESMVMANAEQTTIVLRELKKLGVTLAIDDFGTGYSSLVYLKRLPIDTLKIDKEFIGDITTDPDDEAITATVITMAHSLGLNVIAEGVESAEQLAYLREQGCDEIQGFWLSPPLDLHHCLAFIRGYRPGMELGRASVDVAW